ncbi:MAG: hypothetical protein DSY42_09710 [Aquifex sp.]|nr:MAG: hypothetical protein DSY42_09710 [Aquifex sp.]
MRFILLLFLFLYTIFVIFFSNFLSQKGFYFNADLNSQEKSLENLTINLEKIFNRNFYLYVKKIKFKNGIKIENGKLILVNLEKKTKKKLLT